MSSRVFIAIDPWGLSLRAIGRNDLNGWPGRRFAVNPFSVLKAQFPSKTSFKERPKLTENIHSEDFALHENARELRMREARHTVVYGDFSLRSRI